MLKAAESEIELDRHAAEVLSTLLQQVPAIQLNDIQHEFPHGENAVDLVAHINIDGRPHSIVCEVKAIGQPRYARIAALQLRNYVNHSKTAATPLLIAPYLSPEVQALCRQDGIGFLDFEGNARLVFNGVFIDRQVASKPPAAKRALKSLFKRKSAQVLRVMFRNPQRAWRITELAQAAGVSVGHVSNIRTALLDREWAQLDLAGLSLHKPDALLDAWRDAYEPPKGERFNLYTTLHGKPFDEVIRTMLGAATEDGKAMLASFSAAQWLSPYARVGSNYLYADQPGLHKLRDVLKLSSPVRGENVIITLLDDPDLFRDAVEPAPGIACTSLLQTYLDLTQAGERGLEAADHLRHERLKWPQ
jgi:hypothetical protein